MRTSQDVREMQRLLADLGALDTDAFHHRVQRLIRHQRRRVRRPARPAALLVCSPSLPSFRLPRHLSPTRHSQTNLLAQRKRHSRGAGNWRNGTTRERVHTGAGSVDLDVPRDRNGGFEPRIVPKGRTRFEQLDDKIIAEDTMMAHPTLKRDQFPTRDTRQLLLLACFRRRRVSRPTVQAPRAAHR